MLRLTRLLLEREDSKVASILLPYLTRRLPSAEIERLRAEVTDPKYGIRKMASRRKIKYLAHFTRAENVASILEYGLIPRQQLAATLGRGIDKARLTDSWRHDTHGDASCLSISFPNYRMLFHYLKKLPDAVWAVLEINPSVLWQLDCAFYTTNAASKRMSSIPVDELKSVSAFEALFQDFSDDNILVKRSDLHISKNHPTNPQAEVLVFDIIPPEMLLGVCLARKSDYSVHYYNVWQGIEVKIEHRYFAPRQDYKVWSNAH